MFGAGTGALLSMEGTLEGIIFLSDLAQLAEGVRAYATLRDVSEREVRI